jgi:hypothetical protein
VIIMDIQLNSTVLQTAASIFGVVTGTFAIWLHHKGLVLQRQTMLESLRLSSEQTRLAAVAIRSNERKVLDEEFALLSAAAYAVAPVWGSAAYLDQVTGLTSRLPLEETHLLPGTSPIVTEFYAGLNHFLAHHHRALELASSNSDSGDLAPVRVVTAMRDAMSYWADQPDCTRWPGIMVHYFEHVQRSFAHPLHKIRDQLWTEAHRREGLREALAAGMDRELSF